ncbi:hypothetical protein Plo01_15500 [Planobispora longispora]|uniref:Uncharacterized protein n=2 Tax=Planobispora longispora TaxID=28887 RepID=A0A8J3W4R4_9ACTN|nr:hypothetical protein GCM10020093_078280 [Planobispora longispora]GIH75121.1 hypothetical protein Plo01_15500 [Planobispora longispora]
MDVYERRCRRLMRAYPPRFREHRGEELLGTLLDIAVPGQLRPSLRDSLDIVRGGLRARLRGRPPVVQWLLYRLFGRLVSDRYRMWVRDDLRGRLYIVYALIPRVMLIALMLKAVDDLALIPSGVELLSRWIFPLSYSLGIWSIMATRRKACGRYDLEDVDAS